MDPTDRRQKEPLTFIPRLMDLPKAEWYTSLSVSFLRGLIDNGKLRVVRVPDPQGGRDIRRILIHREDLDSFIDSLPREL